MILQDEEDGGHNSGTMVQYTPDSGTLVPEMLEAARAGLGEDEGTLLPPSRRRGTGTMELDSNLGTMVINSDDDEESTMKRKHHTTRV